MKPYLDADDLVIVRLLGDLIDRGGTKAVSNLLPKPPAEVQRRVDSYSMFADVANSGSSDLLVLRATLEIVWDNFLKPMKSKDEMQLQLDYGINTFSRPAVEAALRGMIQDRDMLRGIRDRCKFLTDNSTQWMVRFRGVLAAGLKLGGVLGSASQIAFEEAALIRAKQQCMTNLQALEEILPRLDRIIEKNQSDLKSFASPYGPAF
jgi:hypothetical protein